MAKRTIVQRDFSLGELREEFLERDDTDLRGRSLRKAYNVRLLAPGGLEARPGTDYVATLANAAQVIEFSPLDGNTYALVIRATSISVRTSAGAESYTSAAPWASSTGVWAVPYRNTVICGYPSGIHVLKRQSGVWSFGAFAFDVASNGETRQPYWPFGRGITITPSGRTGSITVTASSATFTAAHVGTKLRYAGREMTVTAFGTSTSITATVVDELPPTFLLTLTTFVNSYRVGDVVIGQDSGFQGVITGTNPGAGQITVLTLENYSGPDVGEKLSGPSDTMDLTAKASASPQATTLWDEALISAAHGYPASAAIAAGRLVFCDFPDAPSVIALSSTRSIADFADGASDDDAIIREVGDNAPRFLHAITAGDLVLLSDRGLYAVSLQDGGLLTPATFNPVLFDGRGSSSIRPVLVNAAVVFIESGGERLGMAFQSGNVYLKWTAQTLSTLHSHLIRSPVSLCGPPQAPITPESYLLIVNADGSVTAASWRDGQDAVGFVLWQTVGLYKAASPCFGGYWVLVDRLINSVLTRMIERISFDTYLDCTVNGNPNTAGVANHLIGATAAVCWQDRDAGTGLVLGTGNIDMPDVTSSAQIGLPFTTEAQAWPAELIDTPYAGVKRARATRFGVSVQGTGPFQIRANAHTRVVNGYRFGEDLSLPPALSERSFVVPVTGRPDHHVLAALRHVPGPWRVLSMAQEVSD